MKSRTGFPAVQFGIGELAAFHFNGIALVAVVAAENIPVATERQNRNIRGEVDKRRILRAHLHKGVKTVENGVKLPVKFGHSLPF